MRKVVLSKDELEEFVRMYSNTSNAKIAKRFGITKNSVISRAGRLGLKKDKLFRQKQMVEACNKGRKYRQKETSEAEKLQRFLFYEQNVNEKWNKFLKEYEKERRVRDRGC